MQTDTVRLRTGKGGILRPGHPWIYKRQILKDASSLKPATLVSVITHEGKFIGRGYYNPRSEIAVRLFTFKNEPIDGNFFTAKIKAAVQKRAGILKLTNAYRAVFSEADGLPGLIADVYGDTIVFQALTLGVDRIKETIVDSLAEVIRPSYIYEKSDSPFRELEGLKPVKVWWGDPGKSIIEIFEGKAKFLVDIVNGHKTGFYLDQRRSRMALTGISKGKKVLDLFCYTGGFSITAALNGAASVRAIDIKEDWLELGRKSAALNNVSDKIEFIKKDAFLALKGICDSGEKFDIIILDPPSFIKSKRSLEPASKGYKEINLLAMKALAEEGILATFSCSHNMPNEIFSGIVKEAASEAGRRYTILKRCHQAEDHPIVKEIPETEYLKGYFLKVVV